MRIFTKLNVGDTVATSGTRVFKKLTTEEPTPSKPVWNGTDLTGTEWHIPQGWTAEAGYGVFDVSGEFTYLVDDSSNVPYKMISLCIGYIGVIVPVNGPYEAKANCITVGLLDGGYSGTWGDYTAFAIDIAFTSGTDVTNTRLINWLLENGELTSHRLQAGLYDADNNLVASWDTLVNKYGMDVEKNYTTDTYNTDPESPYCVLTNNSELSAGKKIVIADGITSIGATAFRDCNNLTSILIPNSVTSIGGAAFLNCTGLTSFTFPNGVTSFGVASFQGCTSLVSIIIPDGVLSISLGAFYGCASLTSVTIPRSVTSIGNGAFNACSSLNNVYYQGAEEQWAVISIGQFNTYLTNATIHYNYTG